MCNDCKTALTIAINPNASPYVGFEYVKELIRSSEMLAKFRGSSISERRAAGATFIEE